jgi:hypothetical protein
MTDHTSEFVWVFNGGGGAFPSGVFSTREKAEAWIGKNRLTGVLTKYPLNEGAWDWAVREGHFKPTREDQKTPRFIQRFACGEEHYHYGDEEDSGE